MKLTYCIFILILLISPECYAYQTRESDVIETESGDIVIYPVLHGTLALTYQGKTIYLDPYGGKKVFEGIPKPDLVLITDIHGDHFNQNTLDELQLEDVNIVVPSAVYDLMTSTHQGLSRILQNGEKLTWSDIVIEAIPMYNLPNDETARHPKGRGNGYVLNFGNTRLYFSGDTEDIPEMRQLKDIDVAFICMNLPFTMDVDQAADAVLDFQPAIVYPYHFRGREGLSDIKTFAANVNEVNDAIEVRIRNWYPEN